jgi:hypothetical protein
MLSRYLDRFKKVTVFETIGSSRIYIQITRKLYLILKRAET